MGRSWLHTYSLQSDSETLHHYYSHFFPLPPALPSSFVALLLSLPPSVPAGQYSALPLYKGLLFKTLRSDLVPTEAIPLAALCIYHGSPALSRLLTPQFSCLLPTLVQFSSLLSLSLKHTHSYFIPFSSFKLGFLLLKLNQCLVLFLIFYILFAVSNFHFNFLSN